jgi:hypothetical protein
MVLVQTWASAGDIDRAVRIADEYLPDPASHPLAGLTQFMKFALLKDPGAADALVSPEWVEKLRGDFQYTHIMAQSLALLGRTADSIDWLSRAASRGFINYPFLSFDPLLANVRRDSAFQALLEDIRRQWERFEGMVDRV